MSGGSPCYLRSPRRCGPVISPGGHLLSLLVGGQIRGRVPPNLLFVSTNRLRAEPGSNHSALVCVPAKAGSTSFYFWLYHVLHGAAWPYSGPPWIQDVTSSRWTNLSNHARVTRFDKLPLRQRVRVLKDLSIRRFAFIRDPLERAVSAYYSKMACGTGDAADHAGAVRQLLRQAPRAVAAGLTRGTNLTGRVPCVSALDWGRLMLEARESDATRYDINVGMPGLETHRAPYICATRPNPCSS